MKAASKVMLAVLLIIPLAGCAGKELSAALQTYTATADYLTREFDAGRISDETQLNVIAPARESTKAILDQAVADYVAGRPFDWRGALRRIYEAMGPLLRQRTILEGTAHARAP